MSQRGKQKRGSYFYKKTVGFVGWKQQQYLYERSVPVRQNDRAALWRFVDVLYLKAVSS